MTLSFLSIFEFLVIVLFRPSLGHFFFRSARAGEIGKSAQTKGDKNDDGKR